MDCLCPALCDEQCTYTQNPVSLPSPHQPPLNTIVPLFVHNRDVMTTTTTTTTTATTTSTIKVHTSLVCNTCLSAHTNIPPPSILVAIRYKNRNLFSIFVGSSSNRTNNSPQGPFTLLAPLSHRHRIWLWSVRARKYVQVTSVSIIMRCQFCSNSSSSSYFWLNVSRSFVLFNTQAH